MFREAAQVVLTKALLKWTSFHFKNRSSYIFVTFLFQEAGAGLQPSLGERQGTLWTGPKFIRGPFEVHTHLHLVTFKSSHVSRVDESPRLNVIILVIKVEWMKNGRTDGLGPTCLLAGHKQIFTFTALMIFAHDINCITDMLTRSDVWFVLSHESFRSIHALNHFLLLLCSI